MWKLLLLMVTCYISSKEAARILAVFPTPSISHQVPFRPLTHELARRGHDVTVLTADPAYPKGKSPENFTEIDVHDLTYTLWRDIFFKSVTPGTKANLRNQIEIIYNLMLQVVEMEMQTDEMQKILKSGNFDLLILEAYVSSLLGLSHIFKVPVIQMSSFLPVFSDMENLGAPTHPILYPSIVRQKIINITLWDKIIEMYNHYIVSYKVKALEEKMNSLMRKVFGSDVPPLSELYNNIDLLFLNSYPIWDNNRPVPPGVVYLGGIHKIHPKGLPTDLKSYLDGSKHGVIYISFGTNVDPSTLPPEKIQLLIRVFSRLPYDVLWKWDKDVLPGRTANIRISKWLPQSDLLRHPKIKLYIMQGGLQSTDEAITAGVPLIGIPMIGDQWYNVEQYVRHKIGIRLDMETLTEETFQNAIETVIGDDTYKNNMVKLRSIIWDQPQSPLERAVWWTEHVLRHGGGRHLRSPAANIHWTEYYEIKLMAFIMLCILSIIGVLLAVIFYTVRFVLRIPSANVKFKNI